MESASDIIAHHCINLLRQLFKGKEVVNFPKERSASDRILLIELGRKISKSEAIIDRNNTP
jgi:hypothetical protein